MFLHNSQAKNIDIFAHLSEIVVKSWIWYCFFVFLITESLSLFNLITRPAIIGVYIVSSIIFLLLVRNTGSTFKWKCTLPIYWKWYFALFVLVLLPLLLIALYYPPNNYDSMTYHLPRVEHWIQNSNVNFYQTNNTRQLFMSPLAEYIILHWRLILDNDTLVNLVQYSSMILSILMASLIVKKLKGSKLAELLAVVMVATIPMGIMQSTSTQTDYVAAFFTISALYFFLTDGILYLSLCIALGIFTKSTFAIFILPIGVYYFFKWVKKDYKRAILRGLIIVSVTILVNGIHWSRNFEYFGSISGPKEMSKDMFNQSFEPKYIISNIVRNVGTQIGLPIHKYNFFIDRSVNYIHKKLGIRTNDYINTWYSEQYITQFSIHEDLTGNIIFIVLIVTSIIFLLFTSTSVSTLFFVSLIGAVIFSLFLKWQPWNSRLLLPLFVLLAPIITLIFDKVLSNFTKKLIILILLISAIPFIWGYIPFKPIFPDVLVTSNRPLKLVFTDSQDSYYQRFLKQNIINTNFNEVAKRLKETDATVVFVNFGADSWEYPLWVASRYHNLDIQFEYPEKNSSGILIYDTKNTNLEMHKSKIQLIEKFDSLILATLQ